MEDKSAISISKETLLHFVNWTKRKVRLHAAEQEVFCHEREIWWCSLGVNIGFEQDGKGEEYRRPILVIRRFNKSIFWGIPLTTKDKKGKYYYALDFGDGLHRMAILSQLRLLDTKRLVDKIGKLKKNQFLVVKEKLTEILNEEEYSPDTTEAPLTGRLEA